MKRPIRKQELVGLDHLPKPVAELISRLWEVMDDSDMEALNHYLHSVETSGHVEEGLADRLDQIWKRAFPN